MVQGRDPGQADDHGFHLARRLGWSRNALCRRSDRLQGLLVLALLLAALIVVPVALAAGRSTYDNGVRASEALTAAGRWSRAILLETAPNAVVSAPDSPSLLTSMARARWQLPDGTWHVGKVPARAGTPAGSNVRVFLNDAGRAIRPPLDRAQLSDKAVATGLTTGMALELGVVITYLLLRWMLERRRLASWDAEWERVAPRWTRKPR